MKRRRPLRWLRRAVILLGVFGLLCAIPVTYVETSCQAESPGFRRTGTPAFTITEPGYRRAQGDSYLTYPEWYIVHAYTDLAGVTRQSSESGFDYAAGITGFWTSLCRATVAANNAGPVTTDQKITNYIIGVSFTLEMGVIGLYERSIGALTAYARGEQRTAEDEFALAVADDYAVFLNQQPWYEYPFFTQLQRFWRQTPFGGANLARSVERRFALSLEYGAKGIYAIVIGAAAGYAPADLKIMSVVSPLGADDLAADPRIRKLRDIGADAALIETPRYQAFTEILRGLGARGRAVFELAGNHRILTTVIAREGAQLDTPGATELFSIPIQSRPGWRRVGLDTEVARLAAQIGEVERQGAVFEHAYDY